jgi:hypothetical protein
MAKNTERKAVDKVFILLGTMATIVLVGASGLLFYGYSFATGMVKDQLSAQNIYFPEKDSPAFKSLSAEDQAEMGEHAGQQLTTGEQAKVYANNYIGAHLKHIADGKTYAEVSNAAMKDPDNAALQAQKASLFQGETLRGMLLGSGYAFWTFGMIALYASIAAFIGAVAMAVLVLLGLRHLAKIK